MTTARQHANRLAKKTAPTTLELQERVSELITRLMALAPIVGLFKTVHVPHRAFVTASVLEARERQAHQERIERRTQPHRDPGLKFLNRETTVAGTGQVEAPANLAGIATDVEIHFALTHQIHQLARRRNATLLPRAIALAAVAPMPDDPTLHDLGDHLRELVYLTPSPKALTALIRDLEHLVEKAEEIALGARRVQMDDDCPHCGRRSLVFYPGLWLYRCEVDARSRTGRPEPCTCEHPMCECRSNPVGFRHEWHHHYSARTATSLGVGRLGAQIKAVKENHLMETAAQDAIERVRALHVPFYFAGDNGDRWDHYVQVPGDRVPAGHVCILTGWDACVIEPDDPTASLHSVLACVECRRTGDDNEPVYLLYPCPTIRALETPEDDDTKETP